MSKIKKFLAVALSAFLFAASPVLSDGQTKKEVDLIISGGTVLTVNLDMDIIQDGSIAIKNGKIYAIGPKNDIEGVYKSKMTINAGGKIVMPGLINTHTHAAMTLFRGYADDMQLDDWLQNKIWPAEAKYITADRIRSGTRLAIAEMFRSGVTCFNDMYFFEDEVAQIAKEANMRVVIGETIIDNPTPSCKTPDEALAKTETLIKKYKNDDLVSVAVAPHSAYACSKETLVKAKDLADKYKVPIHIHLSETQKEVQDIQAKYGMRPPAFLDSIGLLNDKTIAVHCIVLDDEEIKLLFDKKIGVVYCPVSNMKLAHEVAPITPMIDYRMKASFGTDSAASNNNLSILKEMSTGSLLQKTTYADPTILKGSTAVKMATIDAAKVLGIDDKVGSLEKDKYADIIIIGLNEPNVTPSYDPYSTILYAAEESNVDTVIIGGKAVMKNRKILTFNIDNAIDDMNRLAKQIKQ